MIFRTITDESTGAIKSIGLFGKTINDLQRQIANIKSNGLFNTIFNVSSIDSKAVTNYNLAIREAIANGATMAEKQQIMRSAMEGTNRATAQLIGTTNGATVSTEALTAAQHSSTLAARAQAVALKAASIAGNMLLFTAIVKGIQLAATAIDNWVHKIDKLRETAQNAIDELEDVRSKSESLNQELKTTNERITELENKPNLTFIEQEEIEKLRDTSEELERQIELNKTLLSVQESKTRDSALDYLTAKNSYEQYGSWDMSDVNNGNSTYGNRNPGDIFQGTQLEVIEQQLKEYEELLQRKEDVENRITDFKITNPDETKYTLEQKDALINLNMELQSYDDTLKILNDSLYEIIPNLDSYKDVLNPKYDQSYIDFINSLIDAYDSLFGSSSQTATDKFDDIWNSDSFSNYKTELEELAKAGKLDPEVLESNENYRKLLENTGKTAEETASHIKALIEETSGSDIIDNPFSSFDGTEIGERLQYINTQFKAGELSCKEYFDALNSEIANVDFSNYTSSIEKANAASQQFFTDSTQQVASGLSDLINKFDSGSISVSEYLEGYLSIANTLSTLTDELQENSASWDQNGNAMSDATSNMLDNTQSALDNAITTIQSYQDSIYSLEQLMTGAVEAGTDEFTAHTQVIAEDLANIVATGGQMADEIASTLGTTTSEIANSMSENVSNQSLAAQAIAANTNTAIGDMANSIGQLFDTLGSAISNFKVDLTFGVSDFNLKDVALGILGVQELPEIKFSLQASGESLSTIGSAISSFGKSVASNLAPQMIEMPDFNFSGEDKYTPDSGVLNNYNKKLDDLKNAQKGAGKATKDTTDALKEQKEALEKQKEALEDSKKELEELYDAIQWFYDKQIDGIDDFIDKLNDANDVLEKQKDKYDNILSVINNVYGDEIDAIQAKINAMDKANDAAERELALEKAKQALEEARNRRAIKVKYMPLFTVM